LIAESLYKREKMADEIIARGKATISELLTASFGEWPVKGLDIDTGIVYEHEIPIEVNNEYSDYGSAIYASTDLTTLKVYDVDNIKEAFNKYVAKLESDYNQHRKIVINKKKV